MHTSKYEIVLPLVGEDGVEIEGFELLANGMYGAFDVVDKDTAKKMVADDITSLPPSIREHLLFRGHITGKDEAAELSDALLIGRIAAKLYSEPRLVAVIMPTYDCNFRCPYCFERHRLGRGSEWLETVMEPSMVKAIFASLAREQERGRHIDSLVLFGGEPFLTPNRAMVKEICERARGLGIPIRAITNGYEMDAFLDLIIEYKLFDLQISVDGMGEAHDRHRRHKNGHPTYGRIMENIALALERGATVSLRVNVNRQNIGDLGELIRDIKERGLTQYSQFSYGFKAVEESAQSPTHVTDREVLEAILSADPQGSELSAIEYEGMYEDMAFGLRRAMTKENFPYLTPAHCNAVQGMAIFDPFGKIFPCAYLVGMEDEAIGCVDEESGRLLYGFRKAKWDARTGDFLKPCQRCPYIFFCGGGCAIRAKNESGTPFHSNCGELKDIWNFTASRVAAAKWAESGESELTLSLCGVLANLTEAERETLESTRSAKEMLAILRGVGFWQNKGEVK